MAQRSWTLRLDGETHVVELDHSGWSGRRMIRVDGRPVVNIPRVILDAGSLHQFPIGEHDCFLNIQPAGLGYAYHLAVDGELMPQEGERDQNPGAIRDRAPQSTALREELTIRPRRSARAIVVFACICIALAPLWIRLTSQGSIVPPLVLVVAGIIAIAFAVWLLCRRWQNVELHPDRLVVTSRFCRAMRNVVMLDDVEQLSYREVIGFRGATFKTLLVRKHGSDEPVVVELNPYTRSDVAALLASLRQMRPSLKVFYEL